MGNSLSATLVEHYRSHGYVFPVPACDMDPEIVAFVDRRYGGTPLGVAQQIMP